MKKIKRVLVTGASKGIGKAIAIRLARSGFSILIHYNSDKTGAEDTLEQLLSSGGEGEVISFDVTEREEVQKVLLEYTQKNGPLYGIVSNAGVARDGVFPTLSGEDWDQVMRTNLDGFFNVVKPCLMDMITARGGGRIVALSSVSGITGNRGQVNYSASKAGLIGAVKSLAIELAKKSITVNCVAPGLIKTEMISEEIWEHAKSMIPMKRMGTTEEVANAVNFLFSDEASYITRQVISVNGGMI